jgi:hypothetical protein
MPATVIPCTTYAAEVVEITYSPQAEVQTYRVTFDVRGQGRMYARTSPFFYWHIIPVDSPNQPSHYSFDWTIPRYPGRPTEVTLEGLPVPCKQNPDGLEITNYSITPVLGKQSRADH